MTNALWYLGRGTGVSALILFTIVVVLGIVVRTGRTLPGLPRFAVTAVHRTSSLLALGLLTVHICTLYLDPYAQLRVADIFIPFGGAYRPLYLGLGTLAFDLILLLIGSSLIRQHIGQRAWRSLHWAAYACWPLAVGHAVGNGTDGRSSWLLLIVGACLAAVGAALSWRWIAVSMRPGRHLPTFAATPPPRHLRGLR